MMYVDDDITHDFVRLICRMNDKDATRKNHMIWKDKIVISHQEADRLPGNIAHGEFQVDFLRRDLQNILTRQKPTATFFAI